MDERLLPNTARKARITDIFVERPVVAIVISLLLILIGVRAALEGLPEPQREVFLRKEEGGLTFEEIGVMLGCGKETAKSRMRYALARLKNALGSEARAWGLEA